MYKEPLFVSYSIEQAGSGCHWLEGTVMMVSSKSSRTSAGCISCA